MNKVMLVGRLTRDPELRSLPSGKHVATFTVATNEYRGGNGERTEYHPCVSWDRLAEICGQFLSKRQLIDVEGRLQTRQWDDDAGKRQCHFASLYALSIRRIGRDLMSLASRHGSAMQPYPGAYYDDWVRYRGSRHSSARETK
ncbi:MAG: single-stranded DNA-binding protein [Candidatus Limnocylindria bacterium]